MDRRRFLMTLLTSAFAAPLADASPQTGKVWRIGMLEASTPALNAANLEAFQQALRQLGHVERQDYTLEYRSADGEPARFPSLAAELVRLKVDLIVARGTTATEAAKRATPTIPIVMASSSDPLAAGLVPDLAHPGGNITGMSSVNAELVGKRLEILKEAIPRVARVGVILNLSNATVGIQRQQAEAAARSLHFQARVLDVRRPEDIDRAFETAASQRLDALHIGVDFLTQNGLQRIVHLAAKHRLPTIYSTREFVEAGGLMAYGVSRPEMYRRAAIYVDKIIRGARPAELPIEQPTKLEFIVNLKAARALGVSLPPTLLARADQVLE